MKGAVRMKTSIVRQWSVAATLRWQAAGVPAGAPTESLHNVAAGQAASHPRQIPRPAAAEAVLDVEANALRVAGDGGAFTAALTALAGLACFYRFRQYRCTRPQACPAMRLYWLVGVRASTPCMCHLAPMAERLHDRLLFQSIVPPHLSVSHCKQLTMVAHYLAGVAPRWRSRRAPQLWWRHAVRCVLAERRALLGAAVAEGPGGSASDSGAAAFAAPDGVLEGAAGGAGAGAAAAGGERAASDWRSPASQSSHMSPCLSTRLIHWCMPCAGLPAPMSHLHYRRCSANSQQMTPWWLGHGTTIVHLPAGCFHRHADQGAPPWQGEQPKGGKTVGWAGTPAMVPTTLAGEPATIVRGATSFSTSDPAATCAAGHPALWFANREMH